MNLDMIRDTFDIENVSRADMNKVAMNLEEFVDLFTEIMIHPHQDLKKSENENIKESLKVTRSLIKKLKKGDKSVFRDDIVGGDYK